MQDKGLLKGLISETQVVTKHTANAKSSLVFAHKLRLAQYMILHFL